MAVTPVVIDPVAIDPSRTPLDLNTGGIQVAEGGIDWGDSEITAYMADMAIGSAPVDYRIPNRNVIIPLIVYNVANFEAVRAKLQQKVALLQREGGSLSRGAAPLYADVVNATLTMPDKFTHLKLGVEIQLHLECLPDFYGAEVTAGTLSGTGDVLMTDTTIKGDYPGRVRIKVTEGSGNNQLGGFWGFRSRYYDAAATAKLRYECEAMTPLDAATAVAHTGASGGNVIKHPSLLTDWTPVLQTDLLVGGALTHRGSYGVWMRVFSNSVPDLRWLWDVGDFTNPVLNDQVQLIAANDFYLVYLGEMRLDAAPYGAHRWRGVLQAKGFSAGQTLEADKIWFQPLSDTAGRFSAAISLNSDLGLSAGPSFPASGADDAGIGTVAWTSPGNARLADTLYATRSTGIGVVNGSHYLKLTGFNFNIPSTAIIKGVKVEVKSVVSFVDGGTGSFTIGQAGAARIVKGGVVQSSAVGKGYPWARTDNGESWNSVGGPIELWNTSLTPSEVNSSGFGVALEHQVTQSVGAGVTLKANAVRMTVYYAPGTGFSGNSDAAVYASKHAEYRTDGMFRDSSDGASIGGVSGGIGDMPRIPPAGAEGRTTEFLLKLSRGDLQTLADNGLDLATVQFVYRPCWLFYPDDSS